MKSKAIRFGPGFVAGLALAGTAGAQNLILNGSFEDGYQGEFQRPIPQWISGGTGDVYLLRGHGSSAGLTSANFSGFYSSATGSTLSQTFATIPGEAYSVSFDAYAIRYTGGTSTLRADVTGLTPRFSNTFVLRSNGNSPFFETLSFTFEADSIATTLTFTDGGATEAVDPVLDNVVVLGPSNILKNGNFEQGFQGVDQRTTPFWTIGGSDSIFFHTNLGGTNGSVAAHFSRYNTPVGSVLAQSFHTIPGETYSVSFDAFAVRYAGGDSTIRADVIGSEPRFSQTYLLASNGSSPFFQPISFQFVADSRLTSISLTDGGVTVVVDAILDNVVVWGPQDRLRGNAYLNGYLASVVGDLLEVEVWQNGSLVETLDGNYGPNGTFAFSPTVSGLAVLKFRFRTGLWKAVPVTLGPTPIENLTVNMTNGDCDHDNEVGIGDYALLSSTYGLSVGDPGFDTNADLNGDTTVDIADYAILSSSYGEVGD